MRQKAQAALKLAPWMIMALLSAGVTLYASRYLTGIGMRSEGILANAFARPWLVLHVAGAATALLVGPFQFLAPLRRRLPGVHRAIGRIYVLACLSGALGGFFLALGSTAGPVAGAGFGALSIA